MPMDGHLRISRGGFRAVIALSMHFFFFLKNSNLFSISAFCFSILSNESLSHFPLIFFLQSHGR